MDSSGGGPFSSRAEGPLLAKPCKVKHSSQPPSGGGQSCKNGSKGLKKLELYEGAAPAAAREPADDEDGGPKRKAKAEGRGRGRGRSAQCQRRQVIHTEPQLFIINMGLSGHEESATDFQTFHGKAKTRQEAEGAEPRDVAPLDGPCWGLLKGTGDALLKPKPLGPGSIVFLARQGDAFIKRLKHKRGGLHRRRPAPGGQEPPGQLAPGKKRNRGKGGSASGNCVGGNKRLRGGDAAAGAGTSRDGEDGGEDTGEDFSWQTGSSLGEDETWHEGSSEGGQSSGVSGGEEEESWLQPTGNESGLDGSSGGSEDGDNSEVGDEEDKGGGEDESWIATVSDLAGLLRDEEDDHRYFQDRESSEEEEEDADVKGKVDSDGGDVDVSGSEDGASKTEEEGMPKPSELCNSGSAGRWERLYGRLQVVTAVARVKCVSKDEQRCKEVFGVRSIWRGGGKKDAHYHYFVELEDVVPVALPRLQLAHDLGQLASNGHPKKMAKGQRLSMQSLPKKYHSALRHYHDIADKLLKEAKDQRGTHRTWMPMDRALDFPPYPEGGYQAFMRQYPRGMASWSQRHSRQKRAGREKQPPGAQETAGGDAAGPSVPASGAVRVKGAAASSVKAAAEGAGGKGAAGGKLKARKRDDGEGREATPPKVKRGFLWPRRFAPASYDQSSGSDDSAGCPDEPPRPIVTAALRSERRQITEAQRREAVDRTQPLEIAPQPQAPPKAQAQPQPQLRQQPQTQLRQQPQPQTPQQPQPQPRQQPQPQPRQQPQPQTKLQAPPQTQAQPQPQLRQQPQPQTPPQPQPQPRPQPQPVPQAYNPGPVLKSVPTHLRPPASAHVGDVGLVRGREADGIHGGNPGDAPQVEGEPSATGSGGGGGNASGATAQLGLEAATHKSQPAAQSGMAPGPSSPMGIITSLLGRPRPTDMERRNTAEAAEPGQEVVQGAAEEGVLATAGGTAAEGSALRGTTASRGAVGSSGARESMAGGVADGTGGTAQAGAGGVADGTGGTAQAGAGGVADGTGGTAQAGAGGVADGTGGTAQAGAGGVADGTGGTAQAVAGGVADGTGGTAQAGAGGVADGTGGTAQAGAGGVADDNGGTVQAGAGGVADGTGGTAQAGAGGVADGTGGTAQAGAGGVADGTGGTAQAGAVITCFADGVADIKTGITAAAAAATADAGTNATVDYRCGAMSTCGGVAGGGGSGSEGGTSSSSTHSDGSADYGGGEGVSGSGSGAAAGDGDDDDVLRDEAASGGEGARGGDRVAERGGAATGGGEGGGVAGAAATVQRGGGEGDGGGGDGGRPSAPGGAAGDHRSAASAGTASGRGGPSAAHAANPPPPSVAVDPPPPSAEVGPQPPVDASSAAQALLRSTDPAVLLLFGPVLEALRAKDREVQVARAVANDNASARAALEGALEQERTRAGQERRQWDVDRAALEDALWQERKRLEAEAARRAELEAALTRKEEQHAALQRKLAVVRDVLQD